MKAVGNGTWTERPWQTSRSWTASIVWFILQRCLNSRGTPMTGTEMLADWMRRVGDRKYMTNEWLEADDMKVYVRRGYHQCGFCLDVASVEVYDKGEGTFTRFLEAAHAMNPWDATFVECVNNERLAAFLLRNGFRRYEGDPHSFYLKKGP